VSGSRIRVLVAAHSLVGRQALAAVLGGEAEFTVAGVVGDGAALRAALVEQPVDVVVLDGTIARRDGPGMVPALRARRPHTKVILIESDRDEPGRRVDEGADDLVELPAPSGGMGAAVVAARAALVPRIKALASLRLAAATRGPGSALRLVVIGSSTGGPEALTTLLRALPVGFMTPIAIAQHMPAGFTRPLADRLSGAIGRPVIVVGHELPLVRGAVALAPGDFHLSVVVGPGGELRARTVRSEPENQVRPAADVLFRTAAAVVGAGVAAVVLTGMGKDGTSGCAAVRERGGRVLVQDEASSVIWGMPGSVVRAGYAHAVQPLAELAASLSALERGVAGRGAA
jgi:two-component system, chemotaxis family, protein-glutamate methylesterase/glutaminase